MCDPTSWATKRTSLFSVPFSVLEFRATQGGKETGAWHSACSYWQQIKKKKMEVFWFFEPVESLGGRMTARKRGLKRRTKDVPFQGCRENLISARFSGRVREDGGSVFPQQKAGLYAICLSCESFYISLRCYVICWLGNQQDFSWAFRPSGSACVYV